MGNRETYTTNIKCMDCGANGKGTFTENENTVYSKSKLGRVVDSTDLGFKLDPSAREGISCGKCGGLNVDLA
jgi:hypothetical protein